MVRTGALRGRTCGSAAAVVGVLLGVLVGFSQPTLAQLGLSLTFGQSGATSPHPGQRGTNLATAQVATRPAPAVRRGSASAPRTGSETGGPAGSARICASTGATLGAGSRTGSDRTGGTSLWGTQGGSAAGLRFAASAPTRDAGTFPGSAPRLSPGARAPPAAPAA